MGEDQDLASQFQQYHEKIAAYKQAMHNLFSEIGMPLPDTLYRVHYLVPELVFNKQGFVVPQMDLAFPGTVVGDPRGSVPMIHWDDMNLVSRYFAFPEYKDHGKNFLLIAIDTWKVDDLTPNPNAPLLKHGEYYGKISRAAVKEIATFTWKHDGSTLPAYLRDLNSPAINESEGYIAVKVR